MGTLFTGRFRELEDALVERVLELRRGQALAPLTIVVGSSPLRTHVADQLVRRLGAVANVSVVALGRFAADLAARESAPSPVLAGLTRERLLRRLVAERRAWLSYFGPVSERPHFAQALAATFADLREARVAHGDGWAAACGGARADDLEALYADYCEALERRGLLDTPGVLVQAARHAAGLQGSILVYGVYDLNGAQEAVVSALLHAGADLFVPVPRGAPGDAVAVRIGVAAGLPVTSVAAPAESSDLDRLGALWRDEPPAAAPGETSGSDRRLELRGDGTLGVVSVADERDETREAVRAVLAALAAGARAWDCAVVVPRGDDVQRLAAGLDDAGIPVACRLPDRSQAVRVPRLLAECLAPPAGEAFGRRAVVDLLSAAPLGQTSCGPAAQALWLDEARQAGVVSGLTSWLELARLRRRALELRVARLDERAAGAVETGDDQQDAKPAHTRLRLEAARGLEAAVAALARAHDGLPQRAAWGEWADALGALLEALFEPAAAAAASDVVGRLRALDILQEQVDVKEMVAVLREQLDDASVPSGRTTRDGVAVLTPLELRGLRFHTVVFTSLAEGGFPSRGRPDPILGDGERRRLIDALGVRLPLAEQRDAESLLLFAFACEAARERFVLLTPRSDATSGRPRLPSRLLLRIASLAAGHPVGLDELLSGEPLRSVWRRTAGIPVHTDAEAVWLDGGERDTAALLALTASGRSAARIYLQDVLGEPGAAKRRLAQWRSGRSPEPGAWDGLLGGEARAALAARHPFAAELHPTRLERYISCPFAFLVRDVLELRAPEEPGESLEIEPLEYGTLAHEVLERVYAAVIAEDLDREGALAAVPPAWEAACAKAESRGVTGAAVSWHVRRDILLQDMIECVRRDPVFDAPDEHPVMTEWSFGESAGLPVRLELGEGRHVRFAGRVDRVDATGAGTRVIDYKTGAGTSEEKRIKAGLSVQLPVYQLAVRQAGGEQYRSVSSLYRLVTRRGGFSDLGLPGDEENAQRRLRALVAAAAALVDEGLFPRTSKNGCDYCDIGYACGLTAWARARKREHEALGDVVELQQNGPGGDAAEGTSHD